MKKKYFITQNRQQSCQKNGTNIKYKNEAKRLGLAKKTLQSSYSIFSLQAINHLGL